MAFSVLFFAFLVILQHISVLTIFDFPSFIQVSKILTYKLVCQREMYTKKISNFCTVLRVYGYLT